jgi:lipopolysaccharide biosynthesis glycosyltransferase
LQILLICLLAGQDFVATRHASCDAGVLIDFLQGNTRCAMKKPTIAVPPPVLGPSPGSVPSRGRRIAAVLCADRNMLVPALFVADAALRNRPRPGTSYDVILVTRPEDAGPIEREWAQSRGLIIDDTLDFSAIMQFRPSQKRLTSMTLARLLLPGHFASRYDKLLYLDCDLSLHGDIGRIFDLHMAPSAVAAAPAGRINVGPPEQWTSFLAHCRALGMTEPYRYFNAGVLLIDVARWNAQEIAAKCLDFIRRNPDLCTLPDEDALNAVLDGDIVEFSPIWNMRARQWLQRKVRSRFKPVIVHYDGPHKPWKTFMKGHRPWRFRDARRAYRRFLADTPWSAWLEGQWSSEDMRASLLHEWDLWTAWIRGREPVLWRLRQERRFADAFLDLCQKTPYADIVQGITERSGGGLRLTQTTKTGETPS